MSTKQCPRCEIDVHPVKDKSRVRWKWSKKKHATYVCLACESELVALEQKLPGEKVHTIYTESQVRPVVVANILKRDMAALKRVTRKKKLCPQCHEVWFLIGVCVYPDRQRPLVCSKKCKRAYLKEKAA